MPLTNPEFVAQTADAYQHLYDLVHLRRHPLAGRLVADPTLSAQDKAWRFHQILLDAIEALDPGPNAPVHSREWRRHRLMLLRYVEGLEVQTVADELGISRRHYFREHDAAIEAAASVLSQNAGRVAAEAPAPPDDAQPPRGRLELLRLEAARSVRSRRQVSLPDVLQGAVDLAQGLARQRGVRIEVRLVADLPAVAADRNALRQLLLGLMGLLLEHSSGGVLEVEGKPEEGHRAVLCLRSSGLVEEVAGLEEAEQVRLSLLNELAAVQNVHLRPLELGGFVLEFPAAPPRTVLVVDDNEDALRLLQLCLSRHNYQVVTASSGAEAIAKARELQPFAVTLDLMMPERDGWDVLQTLANQPATQHIPVIICTVLAAEQMALSLGATAFLAKPVSEQALLAILDALE